MPAAATSSNKKVLEVMEHNPELLLERLRVASEAASGKGSLATKGCNRPPVEHPQHRQPNA